MADPCQATARNGKPCSATPRPGRPYCAWHDPEAAEQRREWSRRGGAARSNASRAKKQMPELMTTDEVAAYLGVVFKQVITHRTEPAIATAAAAVARAMIAVTEAGAIEVRLSALEAAASKRGIA